MFDLNPVSNPLFEFSRSHCIAICAFLVPANLLATLQTLLFVWFKAPLQHIRLITGMASIYALIMVLHVLTWFMVGVVMLPTYVLSGLALVCLGINLGAIALTWPRTPNPGPSQLASLINYR